MHDLKERGVKKKLYGEECKSNFLVPIKVPFFFAKVLLVPTNFLFFLGLNC